VDNPNALVSVFRPSSTSLARLPIHSIENTPKKGSAFQQTHLSYSGGAAKCCHPFLTAGLHIAFTRRLRYTNAFGNSNTPNIEPTDVEVVSLLSWSLGSLSFASRWLSIKARPYPATRPPRVLAWCHFRSAHCFPFYIQSVHQALSLAKDSQILWLFVS